MRSLKYIGLAAAIVLIISCFIPWVFIESRNIMVSGVEATGTNFGKPGYFHFVMTGLFILFTLIQRIWAKRCNLLIIALNTGWAARNYFVLTLCRGGDCPTPKTGLWLMIVASLLMLVSALFPDMKLPGEKAQGIRN